MVCKEFLRPQYQIVEKSGSLLSGHAAVLNIGFTAFCHRTDQQFAPLFSRMIMRRRTFDILVATFYNKEVTILYAGDKLHPLTAEMPVKIAYEFRALFGGQMSAMMSADFSAPAETDDIAPHSHVAGFHS